MSLSLRKNKRFVDGLHPGVLISYFLVLMVMAMVYTNPLYLFAILGVVIFGLYTVDGLKTWKKYLFFGLNMAVLIVLTNVFVSKNGQTVLWSGRYLTISLEAFCYGLNMALKLILILSIFVFYEKVLPMDRAFQFFKRFAPNSALTLILASLFIPQLQRRVGEVKLAMAARGYFFEEKNFLRKISSHYPLLKTMLLSSLEDSWAIAEAMQARGFGLGKRTVYIKHTLQGRDVGLVGAVFFSFVIFGINCVTDHGFYAFYPRMGVLIQAKEVWFVFLLIFILGIFPFLNKVCK